MFTASAMNVAARLDRARMSAASCTERACACFSGARLTGLPASLDQYSSSVLTMMRTLAASASRSCSSADAACAIHSGSTPTTLLAMASFTRRCQPADVYLLPGPGRTADCATHATHDPMIGSGSFATKTG